MSDVTMKDLCIQIILLIFISVLSRTEGLVAVNKSVDVDTEYRRGPVFTKDEYIVPVLENQPGSTVLLKLEAYDEGSSNSSLTFSMRKDIFSQKYFHVLSKGEIITKRSLDYEEYKEFQFNALVSNGELTGTCLVTVKVQDLNDNSPVFVTKNVRTSVLENSPVETAIVALRATDADSGLNARIKYKLVGPDAAQFKVDEDTGILTAKRTLDREEKEVYRLQVQAVDMGEPKLTGTTRVVVTVLDVNDNAPVFVYPPPGRTTVTISTKIAIGTIIFQTKATDADKGANGRVRYSLTGSLKFSIDPRTGHVMLAAPLYDEDIGLHKLAVRAADGATGSLQRSSVKAVDIRVRGTGNNTGNVTRPILTTTPAPTSSKDIAIPQKSRVSCWGTLGYVDEEDSPKDATQFTVTLTDREGNSYDFEGFCSFTVPVSSRLRKRRPPGRGLLG